MKDIIIKEKDIKRETLYFIVCLLIMEIVNAVSIYAYNGKWVELIMSIGYVFMAGILLYIIITFIRVLFFIIYRNFQNK